MQSPAAAASHPLSPSALATYLTEARAGVGQWGGLWEGSVSPPQQQ